MRKETVYDVFLERRFRCAERECGPHGRMYNKCIIAVISEWTWSIR